jgi:hypothetical protein
MQKYKHVKLAGKEDNRMNKTFHRIHNKQYQAGSKEKYKTEEYYDEKPFKFKEIFF